MTNPFEQAMGRTDYLGAVEVADGYKGGCSRVVSVHVVHVCRDGHGVQFGVDRGGYICAALGDRLLPCTRPVQF